MKYPSGTPFYVPDGINWTSLSGYTSGYVLTATNSGGASWQVASGGSSSSLWVESPGNVGINTTQNVGIGSTAPGQALDVNGTVRSSQIIDSGVTASKVIVTDINHQLTAASNVQDLSYCQTGGTNCPGSITGFANPSATIGLSANNGSAVTAMRSDATPALGVTISPTWTGNHTFAPSSGNTLISLGNVGIGSATPGQKLDVQGTVRALGFTLSTSPTNGYVLTSDSNGNGSWAANTGTVNSGTAGQAAYYASSTNAVSGTNNIIVSGSNVGISSLNPGSVLDIQGNTRIFNGNLGIGTSLITTSALTVMNGNVGIGTWIPTALFQVGSSGNVGIGSNTPGQALDVNGTIRGLSSGACSYLYKCVGGVDAGVIQTSVCGLCPGGTCTQMNGCF